MEVTRRYQAGVMLVCLLDGGAWLLDQPLLLVGATGIGASLLVQQYRFTRDVLETTDELTLTQSMSHTRVTTDEETSVVVRATLSRPTPLTVTVEPRPPVTATSNASERQSFTLDAGTQDATTTFSLRWPVAGGFECASPTVMLSDRAGFFRSTVSMGPSVSLTVVPRRPRKLHIGAGGTSIPTAFGEHKTGDRGIGLDPAETRRYIPGDAVRQIDWKATARMGRPHVREYDVETDLSTSIVVDHRSSMATGRDGETKLDYLRHVALAYADNARTNEEPISLYTVGDRGVTTTLQADTTARHYTQIETQLHDLVPTDGDDHSPNDHSSNASMATNAISSQRTHTPRDAREMATRLRMDDSPFGRTLLPYVATSKRYVQQIEGDPLYKTIRTYLGSARGSVVTVLLTDDTHRTEVREAVRTARRQSEHVLVFLTPTVLFERGRLHAIESAYDGYVDFEEFRRDLTRISGVTAFEVAPADRIEAILAGTRRTTETRETTMGGR